MRALRSNNDYAKVECRLQANARMFARDVRALRVKSYAFDPFESVYIARKENLSHKIFLRLGLNRSKSTEKEISKKKTPTFDEDDLLRDWCVKQSQKFNDNNFACSYINLDK